MNRLICFLISSCKRTGLLFALLLLSLLATSCSTPGTGRFHEDKSANLVLQYYGWDAIYMTRPDTRQAGFLPLLSRDQVERELRHRVLPRNLAVVLIGTSYSTSQIATLTDEWKKLLAGQGFLRVVVLLAGPGKQIDGLPIIEDSAISSAHDKQAANVAALPPSAGADVANSSGDSSQ